MKDPKVFLPIYYGDTIHASLTIIEKRATSKPDRGIVTRQVEVLNQHGKIVQKGTMTLLVRRKAD